MIFDAIESTRYIGVYSLGVPLKKKNARNPIEGERVLNSNPGNSRGKIINDNERF